MEENVYHLSCQNVVEKIRIANLVGHHQKSFYDTFYLKIWWLSVLKRSEF
jgi:hypothetical protein